MLKVNLAKIQTLNKKNPSFMTGIFLFNDFLKIKISQYDPPTLGGQ